MKYIANNIKLTAEVILSLSPKKFFNPSPKIAPPVLKNRIIIKIYKFYFYDRFSVSYQLFESLHVKQFEIPGFFSIQGFLVTLKYNKLKS